METMERENDESVNNYLTRLKLFHDWILFAKQQLQFVGVNEQGDTSFNDLLQKEQGLKVGNTFRCATMLRNNAYSKHAVDFFTRKLKLQDVVLCTKKEGIC